MSEQWAVHNTVIKNINDLIEYDSNPREHTPEQVEQVANSIREFGWTMPILIDETNEIIAGHGRLMAGKKLGIKEVPCIVAQGWSDEQKKAYCIADNKLTENSTWSKDFLKLNLTSLYDDEFDLALTGFSDEELSKILPDFNIDEGLTDEDDVPTPPEEPVTKLGDIWLCGEHRVMCGDSTKSDDVSLLMNGVKADMVFTDPPWNVNYGAEDANGKYKERTILNDFMGTEDFKNFMSLTFEQMNSHSKKGCPTYVVMSAQEWGNMMLTLALNQYHWSSTIIWNKSSLVLSRKDYHTKYEPIWYGWLEGSARLLSLKDRKQSDVWDFDKPSRSDLHPTTKPVELVARAVGNSSKIKGLVLDLFGGSGSTMIACAKTKRKNMSMELDPKYCDVIVKRWQNYTGEEATLESDGAKFNDMLK
tara:strand:- start:3505 stop:4758 length:1254 start_codon:yes stop_codon:yes gene_type:complete